MYELRLYFTDEEIKSYLRLHGYEIIEVKAKNYYHDERFDGSEEYITLTLAKRDEVIDMNKTSVDLQFYYGIYNQFNKEIKKRFLY